MICEFCGQDTWIKAGISKKSGKPYDAFCSNPDCVSRNMKQESGFKKTAIQSTPKPSNNTDMMRLAYRKDLMIALISLYQTTVTNDALKDLFNDLWSEIEK